MNYLLENAVPIWVAGAVLLTMAGIVYSSLRTNAALLAVVAVLVLTAGALLLEHFWRTPREQIERSLRGLLAEVEADNLPGVLATLAPSAAMIRADAQKLMPLFEIEKARVTGSVEVTLPPGADPATGAAAVRVFVEATQKRGGLRGGTFSEVEFQFQRVGDRWLVLDYSVSEEWRRKAASLNR